MERLIKYLFFLSAFEPRVEAGLQDRTFCVRARDGAKSFEFLSWMTGEPVVIRSVILRGDGRTWDLGFRRVKPMKVIKSWK